MIHGFNKPPPENRICHNQFLDRARNTPIYLLSIEMSILPELEFPHFEGTCCL